MGGSLKGKMLLFTEVFFTGRLNKKLAFSLWVLSEVTQKFKL